MTARRTIVLVASAISLLAGAAGAQAGDTYYEVWRNTTCDLTSATRIGEWLTGTSFTDNTAVPGGYYWVRGLEAQTVHNSWVNLSFSQEEWFTCPTAIERGKPSPIKAKVRLGGGIFGPQTATLYSEVREEDVFFNDTIDAWSVGPLWVSVTSDVTKEWTRDVQIGPAEPITGTAEVYYRSKFGNSLWLPSPVVNVAMRSQMDPAPTDLSVTLQGGKNVITWSPTIGNTAFSAPSRVPRYKALIIGSSDPYSGYAASMKNAFLAWDRQFWRDENIVVLEDPTKDQVMDKITALKQDADLFFFAYAGHGAKNDFVLGQPESIPPALTDRDEAVVWEGNDPSLGRVSSWIVDDELTSWLSSLNVPVVSVIQSCYSGGFWNGGDEGDLERLGLSALVAACPEDETVSVSTPLWTDLLDGCGLGVADTSGDGIITLGEWYTYAKTGDSLLFGELANLQLFAVPEPASLSLLALAGLALAGLTLIRRRRKHSVLPSSIPGVAGCWGVIRHCLCCTQRVGASPLCLFWFFDSRATSRPQFPRRCEMRRLIASVVGVVSLLVAANAGGAPQYFAGTEHYYEMVSVSNPNGISWSEAKVEAENTTYLGAQGYLVTITSVAENTFVTGQLMGAVSTIAAGGYQPQGSPEPAGNWQWVTGEPWVYLNWRPGEPNDGGAGFPAHTENILEVNSVASIWNGKWNDQRDGLDNGYINYVVEFSVPEPSTLVLLGIGAIGLLAWAWRCRRA